MEELHHVIAGKTHIGVSVDSIDVTFVGLIDHLLIWMSQLITFFLVECRFVDYDPIHFPGFSEASWITYWKPWHVTF